MEPIAFLSSVVSAILKGIVEKAAFGSSDRSKRFIALYFGPFYLSHKTTR